ncbi:MAG: ATP-dependent helicase [Sarcina sp.]
MYKLDEYQMKAVLSTSTNTMVVAPPGSGKTTVMLNRVKYLIDKGIDTRNIVVITFTKAAAENMKERFMNNFNTSNVPFFGTFHGLFYKILIRYYGKIDIISNFEAYGVIKKVLSKFSEDSTDDKAKEILNNISLKKCSIALGKDFKPSIGESIFDECFKAYEDYKEYKNLADFDDLQKRTLTLLEENKNILNGYKNLFKYILVDEFQDCDSMQIEFLKFMDNSIFCVGDEDQCIYSFRGSNPDIIVNFENEFNDAKNIYLKYNYRSRKNIVEISKDVIKVNTFRNKKAIESFSKVDGEIDFYTPLDESEQSKFITMKIKERKDECLYSDNAILYRTNIESRNLIDKLIKEKIPFKILDKEFNFFNHFICKDIIAYLKLAIDPFDKVAFSRIINKPYRYVAKGVVRELKEYSTIINCFDYLVSSKDIHPFQIKKIEDLKNDIARLNKMTLRTAIDFILSDLDYLDYIKDYAIKYNQKAEDLFDIIEEFKESAREFNKIIGFFEHIKDVEENVKLSKKTNEDAVVLSTIHGVKGMEFKNVYVINCIDQYMPHKNADNIEEERRIFYVAISRAIENLSIYAPKTTRNDRLEISPFIQNVLNDYTKEYTGGFEINQKVYSKINGYGTVEQIKDGVVTIIFGNILKRFDIRTVIEGKLIEIIKE